MLNIEIENKTYHFPTNTEEVTVSQFFSFLKIFEEYEKFCENDSYSQSFELISEELVNEIQFFAQMILCLTDIPKELVYKMKPQDIIYLYNQIHLEEVPYQFEGSFMFRGCTASELQEKKEKLSILKKQKGVLKSLVSKEVKALKKQIHTLESVEWFVTKDLGNDTFEEFIMLEQMRKKISSLSEKARAGYYEFVPKVIAHLCRKKNEVYKADIAENRVPLFSELPLNVANSIAHFFFIHLKSYSKNSTATSLKMTK